MAVSVTKLKTQEKFYELPDSYVLKFYIPGKKPQTLGYRLDGKKIEVVEVQAEPAEEMSELDKLLAQNGAGQEEEGPLRTLHLKWPFKGSMIAGHHEGDFFFLRFQKKRW